MGDHFDMPDAGPDGDKERQEHAHELATYLAAHPSPNHSLRARVAVLSHVGEAELDRLMPEVDYWLQLFDWQEKHND